MFVWLHRTGVVCRHCHEGVAWARLSPVRMRSVCTHPWTRTLNQVVGVPVIETTLRHGAVASNTPCPVVVTGASALGRTYSRRDG
jgi:hypothetical protein